MKKSRYKKRIFDIIQIGTQVDIPSKIFDYFIVCMIVLSITVTFLRTFEQFAAYGNLLSHIEFYTIIVFIVEYALRLYTSDYLYPGRPWWKAALLFAFSFYGIVDLLTILSYFSELYSNGIVALRMIRAVRILRMFRINKSFDAFNVVAGVLKDKKNQIFSSIFIIAMLILAASLCMYGFEHEAQPEIFNNAFSGIWWAASTVLTIGYGDIYPITLGGRIAAIVIAILGVCAVAVPTGVISAGFVEYYTRIKNNDDVIEVPGDVFRILKSQAAESGMDVNEYVEGLIRQREYERKAEKQQDRKRRKGR